MSKFSSKFAKQAAKGWKKAREAEPGGGIRLDPGTYVGVLTWEDAEVENGKAKGAPVLIANYTVDGGPDDGVNSTKRFVFGGDFLERNLEKLAKELKKLMPSQADEIAEMDEDEISELVEGLLEGDSTAVKFEIKETEVPARDEKGKPVKGKTETIKYIDLIGPIDDSSVVEDEDGEDDEEEDEDEEPVDDDDDDTEDEGDDDDGDDDAEESPAIEKGDTVMYKSPRSKNPAECEVVRVLKSGNLNLKNSRGAQFKNVDPDECDLVG